MGAGQKLIALFLLASLLQGTEVSAQEAESKASYLAVGPYFGFDGNRDGPVYGLSAVYEYRPLPRWGFTAMATYDVTPMREYYRYEIEVFSLLTNKVLDFEMKQRFLSASLGAKFYMKRFFVNSGLGVFYNQGTKTTIGSGRESVERLTNFYLQNGGGYQFGLGDAGALELFVFFSTGGMPFTAFDPTRNAVVGARYHFGL